MYTLYIARRAKDVGTHILTVTNAEAAEEISAVISANWSSLSQVDGLSIYIREEGQTTEVEDDDATGDSWDFEE